MIKKLISFFKRKPETIIYLYFFLSTVVVSLIVKKGVPPDEIFHYDSIIYYTKNGLDPFVGKQESFFQLGDIARETSYFYHYILSLVSRLFSFFNIESFYVLRFINISFGVSTLLVLNKIAQELKINSKVRLVTLLLLANIPMYIFLSASINYDNAIILLTSLSVLLGIKLTKKFSLNIIFFLFLIAVFGPVIKFSFLPISLTLAGLILFELLKNKNKFLKDIKKLKKKHLMIALMLAIIGLGIFTERYVLNIINYGSIRPSCVKLLTHEQCLSNAIYKRTQTLDRQLVKKTPNTRIDVYTLNWVNIMVDRTYGVLAHRKFERSSVIVGVGLTLLYSVFILFIRNFWRKPESKKYLFISILFFVYTASLLMTNLSSYNKRGIIDLAVQGRYWLPVLLSFVLYVVSISGFKNVNSRRANILIMALVAFAIMAGTPYLLSGMNAEWFNVSVIELKANFN